LGKALWIVFIVLFIWLGVLVYFIARGKECRSAASRRCRPSRWHSRSTSAPSPAVSTSASEEIARLADLRDKGAITDAEFASLKAKALA